MLRNIETQFFLSLMAFGKSVNISPARCRERIYLWSWGLGSQPEIEAGSQWWQHDILATRPVVSDKGPGPLALQERILTKTESSEASKVLRGKKSTVHVNRHTGRLRERESLNSWWFELLLWGTSSGFPSASHFWFAWFTVHIWYISGSSHVCTHNS